MITREEYELLKNYRDIGFNWLARDKNLNLFTYREMPRRSSTIWNVGGAVRIRAEHFTFVKWEDEKPTRIDDLIRDYESHKEIVGEKVKATVPQFVADWIEEVKALERSFKLELLFDTIEMPDDVFDWLDARYGDTDILAKAWLDGYEVDKEKLYTVQLKNGYHLCKYEGTGVRWLNMTEFNTADCYKLTQAEIESVDPRLMQIAKEVE